MNEFERQREARIERNKAILQRLIASNPAHDALHAERTTPTKSHVRRPKQPTNEADLRRSGRVRRLPAPVYTTFDVNDDLGDNVLARKRAKTIKPSSNVTRKKSPSSSVREAPSANSLRALNANLWDVYTNYLGQPISPPESDRGALKAAVVHAMSPVSSPKFSKMSGIQEWRNCVALYVNVGDKHGNAYDNVFTRAGSRITWFAQPRQDEDSPVIKSIMKTATLDEESVEDAMIRAENGDEAAPKHVDWPLHLFCRMEGCEYVYCGRLKMLDVDTKKRPMKFTMRLVDAPLLRGSEHFLGLVELADADSTRSEA